MTLDDILLEPDEPAPVTVERATAASPWFLTCDHGGTRIPRRLGDLGVSAADRLRHVGWDIGALDLARALAERLDAVLVHQPYSRLVVDCNRPWASAQLVPERSENVVVPGNRDLDEAARRARYEADRGNGNRRPASRRRRAPTPSRPTPAASAKSPPGSGRMRTPSRAVVFAT